MSSYFYDRTQSYFSNKKVHKQLQQNEYKEEKSDNSEEHNLIPYKLSQLKLILVSLVGNVIVPINALICSIMLAFMYLYNNHELSNSFNYQLWPKIIFLTDIFDILFNLYFIYNYDKVNEFTISLKFILTIFNILVFLFIISVYSVFALVKVIAFY